jgi:hypothetical protein
MQSWNHAVSTRFCMTFELRTRRAMAVPIATRFESRPPVNVTCNLGLIPAPPPVKHHLFNNMASVRKALKNIASGNKIRRLRPPNPSSDDSATVPDPISLPNAIPLQYPPLILIHALLLSAALVLLPQTPIPNLPLPLPARGLDKPQLPFLVPITARPVLTLVWACLGAVLLVPWWAGSLRRWAHDGFLGPRSVQQRLAGDPHIRRVRVLATSLPFSHRFPSRISGTHTYLLPTRVWRYT